MSKSSKKIKIVVVENGHLSTFAVSGGDRLIKSMVPYLLNTFIIDLVIPKIAKHHWKVERGVKFYLTPSIFLEKYANNTFAVFFIYLWRSLFVFNCLLKIKTPYIMYSSSTEIVDWVGPLLIKLIRRDIKWVIRIHHLKAKPLNRPGRITANHFSYLIDQIALMVYKYSDLVVTYPQLKKTLSNKYSKNKVESLKSGVNFKYINNLRIPKGTKSYAAVYVGRIHYTKGVQDLPLIWKKVCTKLPNSRLAIIGDPCLPDLVKEIKNKIKKNGLKHSVDFLGYLPAQQMLSILKSSKVFLFTDHEAGFGLAMTEAMAAGLPVIGWKLGVLGSVVKSGFIEVPKFDSELYATAILKVLQNKDLQKKLSNEAKVEAKNLDWEKVSKDFKKIIISL